MKVTFELDVPDYLDAARVCAEASAAVRRLVEKAEKAEADWHTNLGVWIYSYGQAFGRIKAIVEIRTKFPMIDIGDAKSVSDLVLEGQNRAAGKKLAELANLKMPM